MKRESMLAGACLLLAGCDDPLLEAQRIEHQRVLGARVEAGGDPRRAWPRPEESASVSFLVADPEPQPQLGFSLAACVAAPTSRGLQSCAGPVFAAASSPGLSSTAPRMDLTLPARMELDASGRVLIYGVVCKDALPQLGAAPGFGSCSGEYTLVVFEIGVELDASGNQNPSIADEPLRFDGNDWPEARATWLSQSGCSAADAAADLPIVTANGQAHGIFAGVSDADREPLVSQQGPQQEELFVSHSATQGRLERAFSFPEPGAAGVALSWSAPESASGPGSVVRFYFVMRDLRGGVDWTIRTVCAVP